MKCVVIGKGWDRSLRIFWVTGVPYCIQRRGVSGTLFSWKSLAVVPADGREEVESSAVLSIVVRVTVTVIHVDGRGGRESSLLFLKDCR